MKGRRGLLLGLIGCVLSGALGLLACGRTWGSASYTDATGRPEHVVASGRSIEPALRTVGFALLVMAVALLATRTWGRRVVGFVIVVLGGAIIALAVSAQSDLDDELNARAFGVAHVATSTGTSGWAVLSIVAGGAAVIVGAVVVIIGGGWPALGARYDAPTTRPVDENRTAWEALDRGEDPTEGV